ncbi:kinase-like protein [Rhizopus microsporus var. microsporus]|uniref:Kinase-like protein n=2 Tax=Rhizopus microsporus TaxID=58291 RepID=A0A2G4T8V9_RHIZD|nr:kinase-like protein [Rhizopus microsporus ATCC 52813]ORE11942.1 kinase-like protein [Rhizopus microsporus var. microsporus]PHZ17437.1 kinase-like protein [Rhizopus microsporus ATCC 52813]
MTQAQTTFISTDVHLSPIDTNCLFDENRPLSSPNPVEYPLEMSPNQRYCRLNLLLGRGTFKTVYKAIDREEGYEVAWNVIHNDSQQDVAQEVELLKSIRHPNIIAFHDAWLSDNNIEFIFVTELMTSGTLRQYIQKLGLPNIKIVKKWSRQILKGLAYLHSHNPPIVHRDIKCDNIFVNGAHGEIKIGDLGTAGTIWTGDKRYTMVGTPEFMAPEMYEEDGYNEKVDLYAFGMCLIEMMTGDYPYAECMNTAQVYKKVCQSIKPESIAKIQNQQVLDIIESCLCANENERLSAQELLESPFLAIEPDVILLANDVTCEEGVIILQVVFKGSDRRAVKFDFNYNEDKADEVVSEMIEENVIPARHQEWIVSEINRIVGEMAEHSNKSSGESQETTVWRRECDIRKELERLKQELLVAQKKFLEAEKRCVHLLQQAIIAEEKEQLAVLELEKVIVAKALQEEALLSDGEPSSPETLLNNIVAKEYDDNVIIDIFVEDTCKATKRTRSKAIEWTEKLKEQDILTVGDLRELIDEDWSNLGLTIFAVRALKNMLQK